MARYALRNVNPTSCAKQPTYLGQSPHREWRMDRILTGSLTDNNTLTWPTEKEAQLIASNEAEPYEVVEVPNVQP